MFIPHVGIHLHIANIIMHMEIYIRVLATRAGREKLGDGRKRG